MTSPNRFRPTPATLARELAIAICGYIVYFGVRGMTEGNAVRAVENARAIIRLERLMGILWEPRLQGLIVDDHRLVALVNWVYIWGHWPVIVLAGGWLLFHRPATYHVFRNAFLISGAIGLVIFATFPVAPPRLTDMGIVDTVTQYSRAYRVLQPPAFTNQYAAVPSLHFGWNMLIGIALVREAPGLAGKLFGWIMPVLMLIAVVLTANHYILDVVAGAAVALLGLVLAQHLHLTLSRPRPHRRHGPPLGATRVE